MCSPSSQFNIRDTVLSAMLTFTTSIFNNYACMCACCANNCTSTYFSNVSLLTLYAPVLLIKNVYFKIIYHTGVFFYFYFLTRFRRKTANRPCDLVTSSSSSPSSYSHFYVGYMYDDIHLHVARSYTSSADGPFYLMSSFTLSNHLLLGLPLLLLPCTFITIALLPT